MFIRLPGAVGVIIERMMNEQDSDRAVLFRAILGETPAPTSEQIEHARRALASDSEFQAAFDELRAVVLDSARTATADWYTRLHAYAAAQLAGNVDVVAFADVRHALDSNVALAEEYALLYETLRAESLGALPKPYEIPPVDLSFLAQTNRTSTLVQRRPNWQLQFGWRLQGIVPTFTLRLTRLLTLANHFGRLGKLATASALLLVLVVGLSLFVQPERLARPATVSQVTITSTTLSTTLAKNDPRRPELQILHWSAQNVGAPPVNDLQPYAACIDYVPGAMPLRGCPL